MTNEECARGLRALADVVEQADVELGIVQTPVNVYCFTADEMAEKVRAIGGTFVKKSNSGYLTLSREVEGIGIDVFASHERVCERVSVGTETVEITDPDAPKVSVTREVFEWKCPDSLMRSGTGEMK